MEMISSSYLESLGSSVTFLLQDYLPSLTKLTAFPLQLQRYFSQIKCMHTHTQKIIAQQTFSLKCLVVSV